jgi:hypothetical protein
MHGCDQAGRLRQDWPGYLINGSHGRWNAIHLRSGGVLGPVRTLRKLGRAISEDAWLRPAVTASGLRIAIRAAGR